MSNSYGKVSFLHVEEMSFYLSPLINWYGHTLKYLHLGYMMDQTFLPFSYCLVCFYYRDCWGKNFSFPPFLLLEMIVSGQWYVRQSLPMSLLSSLTFPPEGAKPTAGSYKGSGFLVLFSPDVDVLHKTHYLCLSHCSNIFCSE